MNVSELMVRFLAEAGVRQIFGYPGDPSVEFLEACRREEMDFVLAAREGTAGLMAEATGMLTGKPGVVLSTLGPGSTNLVNAVANATLDRTPLLAISGQIDTLRRPTFTHQVVDQEALFQPISKWVATIAPHTAGHVMRKAYRVATAPRPGAVHLSTPADVVGADAIDDEILVPPVDTSGSISTAGATSEELKRVLGGARRPVILVGIAAMQSDAGREIVQLAEKLGAAIVTSPMAKGTVCESEARFAGTLDMACNAIMWSFMEQADLVVAVGFDAVELIKPWSVKASVVHVDNVPNTDQIYAAAIEVVGPIPASLQAIGHDSVESGGWPLREIKRHRTALSEAFEAGRVAGKLNPSDVIRVSREVVDTEAIVTSDVGSHKLLIGQGWRPSRPRRLLMTNGLSSMGFSLPAAIAAKLASPEREVVCFTGDGGLAMVQSELRLAASLDLGIKVVVFIDHSLNRIELKQMARGYHSTGTVIDGVDTLSLARSMACEGIEVRNDEELAAALAMDTGATPLLIGAHVDPSQYESQF